jgi:hypothetical protein
MAQSFIDFAALKAAVSIDQACRPTRLAPRHASAMQCMQTWGFSLDRPTSADTK